MSATLTAEPRQRLHPLSPLLHSAKYVAVLVAAISIQGAAQLGLAGFVGTVIVVMVFATAYAALSWLVTGYHVVGRELRIYDGLLVRRTRAIPLERLQAVDMVRPLLARLTGLAELRLEVVGGTETEAPLAYLTVGDAAALRSRLLALATRAGAGTSAEVEPAAAAPEPPPVPAEQPLHAVVNRDVVISQLLTPQVIFLPFGIAVVVAQYWFEPGAWSFVVLASMVLAIIGVIRQPARRILSDWNFRLALQSPRGPHANLSESAPPAVPQPGAGDRVPELRVRSGLTETRSQTVPLNRVQAVGVTWPLLWRRQQWLRCRLDVAGYGRQEARGGNPDRLLPVGDLATARRLTGVVLPGVDLAALPLTGPPRRARWLAPFRTPILGAALDEWVFATRDGRITRRLVVVPYQRLQSVRVTQGPLQRRLGLANVYADTAGSLTAVAYHRELTEARSLAGELTERARLAREVELGARRRAASRATEAPADDPSTTG